MSLIKRLLKGSGISLLIAAGIYASFKFSGLNLGIDESLIILFPSMLGFFSSFVIF